MKVKNYTVTAAYLKLILGVSKVFFLRTSEWMVKLYARQKYLSIHESRGQQFHNPKYISWNHCKQMGHFNQSSTSFKFSYLWRHKAQVDLISTDVWFSTLMPTTVWRRVFFDKQWFWVDLKFRYSLLVCTLSLLSFGLPMFWNNFNVQHITTLNWKILNNSNTAFFVPALFYWFCTKFEINLSNLKTFK